MYNGIGLNTPRGSGTSGHIQSNLSHLKKPRATRQDFLTELKSLRENVLPPPRKANPQIIEHERKRQILIQIMKLRKKLTEDGIQPEEIQNRVKKAEKILKQKLEKGQLQVESKDSHLQSELKEKEYLKLRDAFKVSKDYKAGSAFDFQAQQQKRLERIANKQPKYICKHEGCGKTYSIQNQYLRHIKYKHNNQKHSQKQKQSQRQIKQQHKKSSKKQENK